MGSKFVFAKRLIAKMMLPLTHVLKPLRDSAFRANSLLLFLESQRVFEYSSQRYFAGDGVHLNKLAFLLAYF